MAIYSYTLKKYLKAKSTWIIALISGVLIGFVFGGILPFSAIDVNKSDAALKYTTSVVAAIAGITTFLSLFASVFAGFKAASMFKDEVEDGTFLVLLSKPMKRSTIIFMKWLALQTIILGYTIFTVACLVGGIATFDKGSKIHDLDVFGVKTVTSQILLIGAFILAILFVTGMIFSSIGLLLSTKLSVGSTIGISIALGIIIPITSIVGLFTKKDEYKTFRNSSLITEEIKVRSTNAQLANDIEKFMTSDAVKDIYTYGFSTGDSSVYNWAWIVDLNYHISQMSSLAYNNAISGTAKEMAVAAGSSSTTSQAPGLKSQKFESTFGFKKMDVGGHISATNVTDFKSYVSIENALKELLPLENKVAENTIKTFATLIAANSSNQANLTTMIPLGGTPATIVRKALEHHTINIPFGSSTITVDKTALSTDNKISVGNLMAVIADTYLHANYGIMNDGSLDTDAPQAGQEQDWYNFKINSQKDELISVLDSVKWNDVKLANFDKSIRISDVLGEMLDLFKKLDNPVTSFLVNQVNLKEATNSTLDKSKLSEVINIFSTMPGKTINTDALSRQDREAIVSIMAAEASGKLHKLKSVDYVPASGLLIGYTILALALVPLAYWVVKKQDFR